MKKNLLKTVIGSLFLGTILFASYSCSDEGLTDSEVRRMIEQALKENNEKLEFTQWEIIPILVESFNSNKNNSWVWNDNFKRYEAIFDLPELTEFIYENGLTLGFVYVGQQGVDEVQKTLPFLRTYKITDNNGNKTGTYTETIDFDVQYKPNGKSTVAFYLQNSDLDRTDDYAVGYNFRLALVW